MVNGEAVCWYVAIVEFRCEMGVSDVCEGDL
jgi:hypothetical protein